MYTTIKIKCDDQVLSFTEKPKIASGGVNEDKIKFTFDDKWTGFTKKANFYRNSNAIYTADIDQNNECVIPAIVLETSGTVYLSVYGSKDGSYRTTNIVKFKVIPGAKTNAPDPLSTYKQQWTNETLPSIITALNTKFGTNISSTATVSQIVTSINGMESSNEVKADFIDMLNDLFETVNENMEWADAPFTVLSSSMTDSVIESTIEDNLELIERVFSYYDKILDDVFDINLLIFEQGTVSSSIDYDASTDMNSIKSFIQQLKTDYTSFRTLVMGKIDDDTVTLDSADSDILDALDDLIDTISSEKSTIVAALNTKFGTSISTSSTTAQINTAIGNLQTYSQGYNTAKTEDAPKTTVYDTFKGIYERSTKLPRILLNNYGIDELYSVPYINTSAMNETTSSSGWKINAHIQKCGFDLSSAPDEFICPSNTSIFTNATELTDLKLTNCQTQSDWYNAFRYCTKLKNIELYGFNENGEANVGFLFNANGGAAKPLESINFVNGVCTEELDFTGITSFFCAFYNCTALKNIRIVANSIQASISFAQSSLLTKESVLSIINGLDENYSNALTVNSDIKSNMQNTWYAKYNEANDTYVVCENTDPEALPFYDIVTLKSWNVQ